jgi:NADH dehydrogenase
VFRPSVVFGEHDNFLNLFAALQRRFPVMPLGGADARFQPVYVGDVAQAFVSALRDDATCGKTYELAGPQVYTLRQLVQLAGACSGHPRPVIGLPAVLASLQAFLLEHLPGRMMSRDNLASMRVDNIAEGPIAAELGITPTALEAIAPRYLAGVHMQQQMDAYRSGARR